MKDIKGNELKEGDTVEIFSKQGGSYVGRVGANISMFTGKKTLGFKTAGWGYWLLGINPEKQVLRI